MIGTLITGDGGGGAGAVVGGIDSSIVNAKGDLIAATADNTVTRLAVGANDTVLIADSTAGTGLKYAKITAANIDTAAEPRIAKLGIGMTPTNYIDATIGTSTLDAVKVRHTMGATPATFRHGGFFEHSIDNADVTGAAGDYPLAQLGLRTAATVGLTTAVASSVVSFCSSVKAHKLAVSASTGTLPEIAYMIGSVIDDTVAGQPHARVWGLDSGVHGVATVTAGGEQQEMLSNGVFFINNHYSNSTGSPSMADSAGVTITTRYGAGPSSTAPHLTKTTAPVDVGLVIAGSSGSSGTPIMGGLGFRTGIRIGGDRVAWYTDGTPSAAVTANSRSMIGTGMEIMDFATGGIKIWKRTTSSTGPAISVGWNSVGTQSFVPADGLDFGGNVNLYCSAANLLTTDDNFAALALFVNMTGGGGFIDLNTQSAVPAAAGAGRVRLFNAPESTSTSTVRPSSQVIRIRGDNATAVVRTVLASVGDGCPIIGPTQPFNSAATLTATTAVDGTLYQSEIALRQPTAFTGVRVLVGNAGTSNLIAALYDANGVLVANSALAGTAQTATTGQWQDIPFTATKRVNEPGSYYVVVQSDATGTASIIYTYPNGTTDLKRVGARSQAGVFGTIPATITVPTTAASNAGPYASLY